MPKTKVTINSIHCKSRIVLGCTSHRKYKAYLSTVMFSIIKIGNTVHAYRKGVHVALNVNKVFNLSARLI